MFILGHNFRFLNHILKIYIRKERKLNTYIALIRSSYGAETWRLTENNKKRVEATEMDALRRSSRTAFLKLFSSGDHFYQSECSTNHLTLVPLESKLFEIVNYSV
jgi:hypothetical protein